MTDGEVGAAPAVLRTAVDALLGWRVQMSEGRPHWIPPAWLVPDRTPMINTAHHLPEIAVDPDGAITARLRR